MDKHHWKPKYVLSDLGVLTMLLVLTLLSAVTLFVRDAVSDPPVVAVEETDKGVEKAIQWLLRGVRKNDPRWDRAPELATHIESEAEYYAIDPYLLLATLFAESSLRLNQVGEAKGEVGLGQLHGKALKDAKKELAIRKLDPLSLQGQVAQSAWLLSECTEKCGESGRIISRYLTGSCMYDPTGKVGKKVRYRRSLAQKLRIIQ